MLDDPRLDYNLESTCFIRLKFLKSTSALISIIVPIYACESAYFLTVGSACDFLVVEWILLLFGSSEGLLNLTSC